MNSMTGFGRGIVTAETGSFQVEIKTVNTRYCDITIKSPKQFNIFEDKVRRLIQSAFQRGKVEVSILYKESGEQEKELSMNRALCGQIKQFLVEEGCRCEGGSFIGDYVHFFGLDLCRRTTY